MHKLLPLMLSAALAVPAVMADVPSQAPANASAEAVGARWSAVHKPSADAPEAVRHEVRRADPKARVGSVAPLVRLSPAKSLSKVVVDQLPYSEDFADADAAAAAYTVVDANGDGKTWQFSGGKAVYNYHYSNAADDWMFTPGFNVAAGHTYRLKFDTFNRGSYPERIEVKMGSSPDAASMETVILEPLDVNFNEGTEQSHLSFNIPVTADGVVYFGFHAISDANAFELSVDNVEFFDNANAPVVPIFVEDFHEDFSSPEIAAQLFTTFNNNGDEYHWFIENGRARLESNAEMAADDWLVTPGIFLTAGKSYDVTVEAYSGILNEWETMSVMAGTECSIAAMTDELLPPTELQWIIRDDRRFLSMTYEPRADGTYYIGIHCTSPADRYYLNVADIAVKHQVAVAPPAAPVDFTVVPEPTGNLTAQITFKAPAVDSEGAPLEAENLTKVAIYRNNVEIESFTEVAPGEEMGIGDVVDAPGTYRYSAIAYGKEGERGPVAAATVYVGPNITTAPTNVVLTESATEPGMVTLTWQCPATDVDGNAVNPANVTYMVCEYTGDSFPVIAEGIEGTSYTFRAVEDGEQAFKTYVVAAVTARGFSDPGVASTTAVGTPYELPKKQSFTPDDLSDFIIATATSSSLYGQWYVYTDDESIKSQDADGYWAAFVGENVGVYGQLVTGKVNIPADAAHPVVSFWICKLAENAANTFKTYVLVDGSWVELPTPSMADFTSTGWNCVMLPLPASCLGKTVQVLIQPEIVTHQGVPVDNIRLYDMPARDLAISSLRVPALVEPDGEFQVSFTVANLGSETIAPEDYTVKLFVDDKLVENYETVEMPSGKALSFAHNHKFTLCDPDNHSVRVEVEHAGDADQTSNVASSDFVLNLPTFPVPTSLTGEALNNMLLLSWIAPDLMAGDPVTVVEGFEDYDPWATELYNWTLVDEDQAGCGNFAGHPIPCLGQGDPCGFFVFSYRELYGDDNSWGGKPHTGDRALASFYIGEVGKVKSDWAISPLLSGNAQRISFFGQSYSSYKPEKFEVLVSSTGKAPTDFTVIAEANDGRTLIDDVPGLGWGHYEYDLPEGTRYFAIRSTGDAGETFMLEIDDVTMEIAPESQSLVLTGYNVYRNGAKLNMQPVTTTSYIDTEGPSNVGSRYHVTAVYDRGESRVSEPYINTALGIENVTGTADSFRASGLHGAILVENAQAPVHVYTPDGRLIATAPAASRQTIPAAPGLYLLTSGSTSLRLLVK